MRRVRAGGAASITAKLAALLLPLILIILLCFGQELNQLYRDMLAQEVTQQVRLQLDSVADQIDSQLGEINRMSLFIYANEDLRDGLYEAVAQPEEFTAADRISLYSDVIQPLFHVVSSPGQYMLTLYPASDRLFCDYYYVEPLDEFPDALPLQEMMDQGYARTFYNVTRIRGNYTDPQPALCMTRSIYHSDGTLLGLLNTVVWLSRLETAMETILPESGAYWYRCQLEDGQTLFEGGEQGADMVVLSSELERVGATLRFGLEPDFASAQLTAQGRMFVGFTAAALALAAVAIAVASRLVTRRLRMVLDKFAHFAPGRVLHDAPLDGWDEAARLDQTFTRLYRESYESIQAQQKMKADQRSLETSLMLARINPHFLYNTLSAIRWKLPQEEWETMDALVAFYRGILGKGREYAPLYSEAELMKQYVDLNGYTYSRRICFTESLPPDAMTLLIPKFLLQPVFENAIAHSGDAAVLNIELRAQREGGKLAVTVRNDGTPIQPQVMAHLNALNECDPAPFPEGDSDSSHGYAIFNVITRIRLLFGDGYGLWYEREDSGGTIARFLLPICESREAFENCKKS